MKHYLFLIFGVAAFFLGACQENEEFVYHSSDHIYFHFKDLAASKITHSFAYAPDAVEDTILFRFVFPVIGPGIAGSLNSESLPERRPPCRRNITGPWLVFMRSQPIQVL